MDTHHLKISTTLSVALCLFDGLSNSTISEIANLPIIFSTGDYMNLDFYIILCYELRSLGLDNKTTLVLSNTRELDRDLSTN